MSVLNIFTKDGTKYCQPVRTGKEYLALRNSANQVNYLKRIRIGNEEGLKRQLVQFNYSCLPNEDGTLKGTTRMSSTVGMDVDHIPTEDMETVKENILSKKDELGLLMLEVSARRAGYHLVFIRRPELTQEENLRWASDLLGVEYDQAAKDITRVFFTTSGSEEDLLYLDDEIFYVKEVQAPVEAKSAVPSVTPSTVKSEAPQAFVEEVTTASLYAFDHSVQLAGLDPDKMDIWGENNWHNNLLAVLSIGLPKLISKQQLQAVIQQRLPNYSQTEDCRKLINYFYDKYEADKGYMSKEIREINVKMQKTANNNDDGVMDSLIQGWNPPPMPPKIPRLIKLLLKPFPKQYHPMLAVSACVGLGAVGSHYRSIYLDGKEIAPNLYADIIAPSGSGKYWVNMLIQLITNPTLKTWDDQEWEKVRANQLIREQKSNAKDKPAKYHPKLRMMETMSKTSFLELQTNLGDNGMLLCCYTESDVLANSSKAQFSDLSALLRKAWDGDIHRQYYISDSTVNTQCTLRAAVILTGTPQAVLSKLFSDTENGSMQRFIHVLLPKVQRTFTPPKYIPLSNEEQIELDSLLLNLWNKDLSLDDNTIMLEMPKTQKMIEKWYRDLEERYNDGEVTEAEADLSHRIGQFMQRAAMPFQALYDEEKKEVIDFVKWLGDYAYYNICHIFGSRVMNVLKENEKLLEQPDKRETALPLLQQMPKIFTSSQLKEIRIQNNQTGETKTLLHRWAKGKRPKVRKLGNGVYLNLTIMTPEELAAAEKSIESF